MQLPTEPKFSFFRSSVFLAGPVFNSGLGVVSIVHQCYAPNSYSSTYYIQVAFEIVYGSLTSQYMSPHGHRYVNRSVCHNFLEGRKVPKCTGNLMSIMCVQFTMYQFVLLLIKQSVFPPFQLASINIKLKRDKVKKINVTKTLHSLSENQC